VKTGPWRTIAAAGIVAAGFCFVAIVFVASLTEKDASDRDFIEYWAAEHQLVHGANPYDGSAIFQLERSAGMERDQPEVMFSPPVAFALALPLGFVGAKTGLVLWLLALLASLSASLWILWALQGRPETLLYLLGFVFPPALMCLKAGQLGIFLLLGVVLFLYFHKSRPFLAGASLLPCALKPHLFLPVAIALILWVASRKAYRILAGFLATLGVSCALTLGLDAHVWSEYSQTMRTAGIMDQFVPTLSVVFRFLLDRNAGWLQFLPSAAACVWALWYFWTRRKRWSWTDQGLLLLLVSSVCTPYAWFTDESVLLPAVLYGIFKAKESRRSLLPIALITGIALCEVLKEAQITSPYYLWTTPAWLAWYLYATWSKDSEAKSIHPEPAIIAN